jgi:transcriptional regulator with XRE-family HTH domain
MNIERFREQRIRLGLTKRELAKLCNMKDVQIHRYEAGANDPSTESLRVLAEALQVSADYLLDMTDEPGGQFVQTGLDRNEREVLSAYREHSWAGIIRLGTDRLIGKSVQLRDPDIGTDDENEE